jgi:DNA-binding beta-propeller fold protein YncE
MLQARSKLLAGATIAAVLVIATASRGAAQERPAGTLVTSNMNDNTASLVDAASGRALATLPTGEGPHEVAISRDGRWAAVSNYGVRGKSGNTITVIDLGARTVSRTLEIHDYQRPHGMAFLPGDTLLAVTAEASRAVLLVDFRTGRVARMLPTNGRATHMLGLSANGMVLVAGNIADGTISVLHPSSEDSASIIHVAAQPEGIAIAPDGLTAWAGSNRDSVVVIVDLVRGAPIDTLRGFGLPYRMAISPDGRRAVITDPVKAQVRIYDAHARRQLHLLDIAADSLVATAEVVGSPSPEGVTISRDSRWAFVTLQGRNRVITIDLERGTIVGSAVTGSWSDGVGYSPIVAGN